jgi:hypothetical protein
VIVADTGNAVLRCIELPTGSRGSGRVSTIAGVANKKGAEDGWESLLNSPTSVALLPGGELIVADTGNHTLRLVELGGKGPLIQSSMEGVWDKDVHLKRVAEKRKQSMLGKLTTIAGKAGIMGCADGRPSVSLLASPTSLVLSGKPTSFSSTLLFLQAGGYADGGGGVPLLRQLSVTKGHVTKPNTTAKLVFTVSTLHRFGEEPRRGPTSLIELAGPAKELLVAEYGMLQLLEHKKDSDEYQPTIVCDETGNAISLHGALSLSMAPSGVVVIANADKGTLHRLLTPHVWKKADRKCVPFSNCLCTPCCVRHVNVRGSAPTDFDSIAAGRLQVREAA